MPETFEFDAFSILVAGFRMPRTLISDTAPFLDRGDSIFRCQAFGIGGSPLSGKGFWTVCH